MPNNFKIEFVYATKLTLILLLLYPCQIRYSVNSIMAGTRAGLVTSRGSVTDR
jgi:hypothetical protein